MGQSESSCKADQTCKTPASIESWTRQDYLNRLGAQANKKRASFINASTTAQEAADLLESKSEWASSVTHQNKGPDFSKRRKQQVVPGGQSTPTFRQKPSDSSSSEDELEEMKRLDSSNAFRSRFLRKLSDEKVWVPAAQRAPKHQTVIIFDWDDTLLCTSFLARNEHRSLHPTTWRHLQSIEKAAGRLLERAIEMGNTFIITNAIKGWVEHSAARWAPGLLPMLEKVRIISARSRYEPVYPRDVSKWKISAFLDLQRELSLPVVTNLTSLGDAHYEMEATRIMGKKFDEACVKTVKFQEAPTPDELLKQLELVERSFESVVGNARNLKVSLERRKHVSGSPA